MGIRRVALIVFYDDKKRILLQYRKGMSKFGEEWGYFGGSIEKGETPEQAVVRETKEELDFNLKDFKFIGKFVKPNLTEAFVFILPLEDKLSKFRQLEGEKMELFTFEEASKLKMVPGDEVILEKLRKII